MPLKHKHFALTFHAQMRPEGTGCPSMMPGLLLRAGSTYLRCSLWRVAALRAASKGACSARSIISMPCAGPYRAGPSTPRAAGLWVSQVRVTLRACCAQEGAAAPPALAKAAAALAAAQAAYDAELAAAASPAGDLREPLRRAVERGLQVAAAALQREHAALGEAERETARILNHRRAGTDALALLQCAHTSSVPQQPGHCCRLY